MQVLLINNDGGVADFVEITAETTVRNFSNSTFPAASRRTT